MQIACSGPAVLTHAELISINWKRFLGISRTLPTIQLFDAVWQLVFPWLHTVCPRAGTYLKSTYFKSVTPENLQRQLHCRSTLWGSKHLWFAGFLVGDHRHVSRQLMWDAAFRELSFLLARACARQSSRRANRNFCLHAGPVQRRLVREI